MTFTPRTAAEQRIAQGCASCSKPLSAVNTSGFCRRCCGIVLGGRNRKHPQLYCRVCKKPVRGKSGLCRSHFVAERLNVPEIAERRRDAHRRYYTENREEVAARNARTLRRLWKDPAFREQRRQAAKKIQPLGQKASQAPEVRARAGKGLTEHYLGWCPAQYRAEYTRLMKRVGAAAARTEIRERIAADRRAKPALTFEQQLALVESGRARIVEKPRMPVRTIERSMVGCAAGMMAHG